MQSFFFSQASENISKPLGKSSAEIIIINAVIPLLFAYSKFISKEELKEKALMILESLKAEKNTIIENWHQLGIKSKNALDTQGLLELKNEYCFRKKMLKLQHRK